VKTTIEIADALLAEAKALAAERNLTLRQLVECGLRKELADRKAKREKFVWKDLSYGEPGGSWLRPPFTEDNWSAIREASYKRDDDV
jgi:hypothetical protein